MPTYSIQAPNGKTYKIDGPEGASQEDVQAEVLRQFPDAGGGAEPDYAAAAAQDAASGLPANPEGITGSVTDTSLPNAMADSARSVLGNMAIGLSSIPDILAEGGQMATNAIGSGIGSVGSAVLNAHGAPEAANKFAEFFAPRDTQTMGEMIGQVTPEATPGVGFASQMLGGALMPFPGAKAPSVRIPAPTVASQAQQIVNAGENAGVRVMTTDVRPPKNFFGKFLQQTGERIPIAGTGGGRAAQAQERQAAVKNLLEDFGVTHDDAVSAVAADLSKTRGEQLTRLTRAKNAVIDGLGGDVPMSNAVQALNSKITELKALALPDLDPVIGKLQGWKDALSEGKSLRQIETVRKVMGQAFSDPSLASVKTIGEDALSGIYGPLRADMGAFIKQNGGPGDFNRWKGANDALSTMAGELKVGTFKRVLNNTETTPEAVGSLLFSTKPSDVSRLYAGLSTDGKAKAQAAVLGRALEKAGGLDDLSPDKFIAQLQKLGAPMGIMFNGAERERLDGFVRLLKATSRAPQAALAPPTGVQATIPATILALGSTLGPILGATTLGLGGLAARVYESAPMRDLLLRLARTPEGSKAENALISRIAPMVAATIQRHPANDLAGSPGVAVAQDGENGGQAPPQQQPQPYAP